MASAGDVAALPPEAVCAFDGRSRLHEAGLVYAAIAKGRMGKHAEARQNLETVLKMKDVTPDTKQWAKQVLTGFPE